MAGPMAQQPPSQELAREPRRSSSGCPPHGWHSSPWGRSPQRLFDGGDDITIGITMEWWDGEMAKFRPDGMICLMIKNNGMKNKTWQNVARSCWFALDLTMYGKKAGGVSQITTRGCLPAIRIPRMMMIWIFEPIRDLKAVDCALPPHEVSGCRACAPQVLLRPHWVLQKRSIHFLPSWLLYRIIIIMVVILITCVLGQLHNEHSIPTSMVLAASIRSYAVFFTLGIVLCFPTCHTSSQPLWLWVQKWIIQQNPVKNLFKTTKITTV